MRVMGGWTSDAQVVSSKVTRAMSSGTVRSRSRMACNVPAPSRLFVVKTASGDGAESSIFKAAAYPASIFGWHFGIGGYDDQVRFLNIGIGQCILRAHRTLGFHFNRVSQCFCSLFEPLRCHKGMRDTRWA